MAAISSRQLSLFLGSLPLACILAYTLCKAVIAPIANEKKQAINKLYKQIVLNVFKKLSKHERIIASYIIEPNDIDLTWDDVGGLKDVIQSLHQTVLIPWRRKDLFIRSKISQPPKGVLLHGPRGCGKTMLGKITAKSANLNFIYLDPSILNDNWYKESQLMVTAIFSLASKIQPCIVFIDEIDRFMKSDNPQYLRSTAMMKTQFLSLWDSMVINNKDSSVLIMGATNKVMDLDEETLNRMTSIFFIPHPCHTEREKILYTLLNNEKLDKDVNIYLIAKETPGFTGCDLKELCRITALKRVQNYLTNDSINKPGNNISHLNRPIEMNEFLESIDKIKKSQIASGKSLSINGSLF